MSDYNTGIDTDETNYNLILIWAAYVKETSNDAWVCSNMLENMYDWVLFKKEEFGSSIFLTLQAFVTNIVANVISINNVFESMSANDEAGDSDGVIYDSARLIRLLIDFNPVEQGALLLAQSAQTFDSKSQLFHFEE